MACLIHHLIWVALHLQGKGGLESQLEDWKTHRRYTDKPCSRNIYRPQPPRKSIRSILALKTVVALIVQWLLSSSRSSARASSIYYHIIMDPLAICTTVTGLVRTSGTAATMCSRLITKYETAPAILASIRTECITVKTALSYMDWIIKQDADLFSSQLKAHSPLLEIFEVPLTGCIFTFSLLDIELQKLCDRSKDHGSYKWKDRMKYVWNEERAKAILDHMRGLQSALDLMLTVLQTYVSYSPTRFDRIIN